MDYFFLPPVYSFAIKISDVAYFSAFVFSALAGSWVSSSQRRDRDALRSAHGQLEIHVAERTSELRQANSELRVRERQLRLLTEVIPQQIWSAAPDGSIDYCNQRLLDYVGRSVEEMRAGLLAEAIHPGDRERFGESWQRALSSGMQFECECRIRAGDGQYRSFFTQVVPLRDASGEILRWYGTSTDIEERKRAEQALMSMQGEIAHLSRLLTMGELTASIAHELNQPLAAVVNYGNACLEWLGQDPPDLGEARHAARKIVDDGSRAGAIIGRIRALFKKAPVARGTFDINAIDRGVSRIAMRRSEPARHHLADRLRSSFAQSRGRPGIVAAGSAQSRGEQHGRHERCAQPPERDSDRYLQR